MTTTPPAETSAAPDASDKPAPSWTKIITFASFGLALVALTVTIWSVGPRTLLAQLAAIGWGFAAVIAIEVGVTLCDSAALSGFLGAGGRRPTFLQVAKAQIAGRAVNAVTPLASLGEATKATTLMEHASSRRAIAAVFHYNLASVGVRLLTIAIGAPICALVLELPTALAIALYVGAAVAATALVVGALLVRRGMLVTLVDTGRAIRVLSKARAARWRKLVLEIDRTPYRAGKQQSQFAPAKWIVVSRVLALASMWVVLASVGHIAGPGTIAAIATAGTLISMIASIVPMGLGISEGSNAALFAALGAPASLGVTMVLGTRITLIAYAVLGLVLISASSAVAHGARHVRARTQGGSRRLTATMP